MRETGPLNGFYCVYWGGVKHRRSSWRGLVQFAQYLVHTQVRQSRVQLLPLYCETQSLGWITRAGKVHLFHGVSFPAKPRPVKCINCTITEVAARAG